MEKQLFIGSEQPCIDKFVEPVNQTWDHNMKPLGGLWTSSWIPGEQQSDWVKWCVAEDFSQPYNAHWFLLSVPQSAKVYTIDSMQDLTKLLRRYGRTGKRPITGERGKWFIDFEKLALDYDGLHLTEQGNAETHWGCPVDLNCWDVESTVWFHWVFESIEEIAVPVLEASIED